jgi:hypothetical protein
MRSSASPSQTGQGRASHSLAVVISPNGNLRKAMEPCGRLRKRFTVATTPEWQSVFVSLHQATSGYISLSQPILTPLVFSTGGSRMVTIREDWWPHREVLSHFKVFQPVSSRFKPFSEKKDCLFFSKPCLYASAAKTIQNQGVPTDFRPLQTKILWIEIYTPPSRNVPRVNRISYIVN